MSGLIVLFFAFGWLLLAVTITRWIARFIAPGLKRELILVILFPLVLVAPFADEAIGRWQFNRLCENEAKVWVSPTANQVVAALRVSDDLDRLDGFLIPVQEQAFSYVDAKNGQPFYSVKAFHTDGGMLMRAGLNMGHSSSCWPKNWTSRENGIDIDKLLERGKEMLKRAE